MLLGLVDDGHFFFDFGLLVDLHLQAHCLVVRVCVRVAPRDVVGVVLAGADHAGLKQVMQGIPVLPLPPLGVPRLVVLAVIDVGAVRLRRQVAVVQLAVHRVEPPGMPYLFGRLIVFEPPPVDLGPPLVVFFRVVPQLHVRR